MTQTAIQPYDTAESMRQLNNQYEINNMNVRIYSPKISKVQRQKNDVQIRNKISRIIKDI